MRGLYSDTQSFIDAALVSMELFEERVSAAKSCLGDQNGPLTADEIEAGFVYASEATEHNPIRCDFRWNADYSGAIVTQAPYFDDASYARWQGDWQDDASGEGQYAYEKWDAQNLPTQADKMEGEIDPNDYIPF